MHLENEKTKFKIVIAHEQSRITRSDVISRYTCRTSFKIHRMQNKTIKLKLFKNAMSRIKLLM